MKILYLVERPTQFEAPFFRYVHEQDPENRLRVLFTAQDAGKPVRDPELGLVVDWQIEPLAGYDHGILAADESRRRQLEQELEAGCDLLITNGYRGPYWQAVTLARRAGIATALRLDSVGGGSWPRRIARRAFLATALERRYDVFLATGTRTDRFLAKCGIRSVKRPGRFPYAVDVSWFRQESRLLDGDARRQIRAEQRMRHDVPADAKVVLAVAKFNRREAPWDLVKALSRVRHPARVWLAGAGIGDGKGEQALANLAQDEGVRDQVDFIHYVDYPKLPALYAAADLFVHAAREENWGVSVAEALACGLPVIASSGVGAGEDLIVKGHNGFVYPWGDHLTLAKHVDAALDLAPGAVEDTNESVLREWDYGATWKHLLDAAAAARSPRQDAGA
jgi:glycosyltransferase involved in cell wall biosynthesis